jgi:hypothetical protein
LHEKSSADFPNQTVFTERLGTIRIRFVELLCRRGKLAEAKSMCQKVAELGGAQALNDFAWSLATARDPNLRDGTNAVFFAEIAVAATSRKNAFYLDTLAAAYAEAAQFINAITIQKEAIALLSDEKQTEDFASRLKLYEANSPYRQP